MFAVRVKGGTHYGPHNSEKPSGPAGFTDIEKAEKLRDRADAAAEQLGLVSRYEVYESDDLQKSEEE